VRRWRSDELRAWTRLEAVVELLPGALDAIATAVLRRLDPEDHLRMLSPTPAA
jgi:hypothetical protein